MKGQSLAEALKSTFVLLVIVLCMVAGWLIFDKIMGNPINFEAGNREGHPLTGNYLGIIYRGGMIVPLLMAVNLILLSFVVERYIMLWRAKGRGNLNSFVRSREGYGAYHEGIYHRRCGIYRQQSRGPAPSRGARCDGI